MKTILLMLLGAALALNAEKIAEFELLTTGLPLLRMNEQYYAIYSPKDGRIFLFDRKNAKPCIEFGKLGEGPGEIRGWIQKLVITSRCIYVESFRKLSLFNLKGVHLKDMQTDIDQHFIGAVGNHILLEHQETVKGEDYVIKTATLNDQELKEIKIIYREKDHKSFNPQKRYVATSQIFITSDEHHFLVLDQRNDGSIILFDSEGGKIGEVLYPFEKLKIPDEVKNGYKNEILSRTKNTNIEIIFQDFYPPFYFAFIDLDSIVVVTQNKKHFFKFSGEHTGTDSNIQISNVISDGYFYKLKMNEDTEMCELHRWPVRGS